MRISDWSSDVCSSDLKRFAGKEDACGFVRFAHHCAVHPASGVSSLDHLHPANAAATAPATHGDRSASGGDHRAKDRLIGFATEASVETCDRDVKIAAHIGSSVFRYVAVGKVFHRISLSTSSFLFVLSDGRITSKYRCR